MNYEKMTGAIDLEELEVQADEVADTSAAFIWASSFWIGLEPAMCLYF